ncbi:MAG TPA: hypothetical protein VGJ05_03345 [Fimbriiglobus sp.]
MTTTRLRVFRMPEDDTIDVLDGPPARVRVRLGDLLPLVAIAQKLNFIWLKDFLDDEVAITEDLHEVIQTFGGSRPAAG